MKANNQLSIVNCQLSIAKILCFSGIFLLITSEIRATHIVGGNITYRYLDSNRYEITLTVYRDCYNGVPPFDNPASIGVFNDSNQLVMQLLVFHLQRDTLPKISPAPCLHAPVDVCVETTLYIDTVVLPPIHGGYQLAYQRCCRNNAILNILGTDSIGNIIPPNFTGATYYTTIPDTNIYGHNSSPVFNHLAPLFICAGYPFSFDHSATDYDGDSLVYTICTPFEGGSQAIPTPQPPNNPPYTDITWNTPYSLSNVLGGAPPLAIDPHTGLLTCYPQTIGRFVVGVCVEEYRNGHYLGQTKRDFQFNVMNCPAQVVAAFFAPVYQCHNTVHFSNLSTGAAFYSWDFGVDTSLTDTSSIPSPNYTYPDTGAYTVRLIAVDSACVDTSFLTLHILPDLIVSAGPDRTICLHDTNTTFNASAPNAAGFLWSPSSGLNDSIIANPVVSPNAVGTFTYHVQITNTVGCSEADSVTVTVLPLPATNAGNDTIVCIDGNVTLNGSGGVSYHWSPATGLNNPDISNPTATIAQSMSYTLTATGANGCSSSDSVRVNIYPLTPADAGTGGHICNGDTIQLHASGGVGFHWFPATGLNNVQISNPFAFPPATILYHVTVTDTNGCSATDSVLVDVFSASAGPDTALCSGDSVTLSVTAGAIIRWSPATGLSDTTAQHPFANPSVTTTYHVMVKDTAGCVAFASETVSILASTKAKFSVKYYPGCDGIKALFTNMSKDASTYQWNFGDGVLSVDSNPVHIYPSGNGHIILLVAVSSEGCRDTFRLDDRSSYFSNAMDSILIPNIITPNDDGLNDCFQPLGNGLYNDCYLLEIYNRWGELVFASELPGHCWDGTSPTGQKLPEGTYFYLLDINGWKKAGFLQLVY